MDMMTTEMKTDMTTMVMKTDMMTTTVMMTTATTGKLTPATTQIPTKLTKNTLTRRTAREQDTCGWMKKATMTMMTTMMT